MVADLSMNVSTLQGRFASPGRLWIQRVSGVLMRAFAGVLAHEVA
jgi:hypothetical protein